MKTNKYLNLGCGSCYSTEKEWVNLDFHSKSKHVVGHNLLEGIPFENDSFEAAYHSHVLEHFTKEDAEKFLNECFRVLKQEGILRIAIPDLERIAKTYLETLIKVRENEKSDVANANYNWILLEMYDQTVRNYSGGEMAKYLKNKPVVNKEFIIDRIGYEGKLLLGEVSVDGNLEKQKSLVNRKKASFLARIKNKIRKELISLLKIEEQLNIGSFRLGGEIHQWMYDSYSLKKLLEKVGFSKVQVVSVSESKVPNWEVYGLETVDGKVRKPDSLFIEATKL